MRRRVCNIAQIRELEQSSFRQIQSRQVMQRAGEAVAAACGACTSVLAVAGPGNNGGDALVAAAALVKRGVKTKVWMPLGEPAANTDAAAALADLGSSAGSIERGDCLPADCCDCDVIIDGLFGIGLSRPLDAQAVRVVELINAHPAAVVAVDVPSGLHCERGTAQLAVRADRTVTFYASKPGLHMRSGADFAGQVIVETLGFADLVADAGGELIEGAGACSALKRDADSHKGSFGAVAAIGGSTGMLGALLLACRAALAHGAGRVYALPIDPVINCDPQAPEIIWPPHPAGICATGDLPEATTVLLAGCGMGTAINPEKLLALAERADLRAVYDADALNLLARLSDRQRLAGLLAAQQAILTPHPAEAARLLGCTTSKIQQDRIGSACQLAAAFDCVIVLKGSGTVVADTQGKWGIVAAGNPALATAGSGDVLAGIIAALRAQGLSDWDAAGCGAWLHAAAADAALAEQGGWQGVGLARICRLSAQMLAAAAAG
ncbi:MAG: NAD(P)H-hydrate dehydratase [Betaproteobacteria bacterium]|nr:NAD(P)H-hydrate dehydratase [Betaproteobacteria bacterium]